MSFIINHEFANKTKPLWDSYLTEYFKSQGVEIIKIIDKEEDEKYRNQGWDRILVFSGIHPVLRVEIKTRREKVYRKHYLKDYKYLIEVIGNIEKYELTGDRGSSIYNSNAELWAIGFVNSNLTGIVEARIFWRKPFVEWLKKNENKLQYRRAQTDGLYHTLNVLVPVRIIDRYIYKKENRNLLSFI